MSTPSLQTTNYYLLFTSTHTYVSVCYVLLLLLLQVLIDKSEAEDEEGLPCLVYMSREKSLQRKHHYKAGNMNALVFYLALSQ